MEKSSLAIKDLKKTDTLHSELGDFKVYLAVYAEIHLIWLNFALVFDILT